MRKLSLIYLSLVLLSLLGTLLFLCYHHDIYEAYDAASWLKVLVHSLPHHLTVAGYVMALPLLAELLHVWVPGAWHRRFMIVYMAIITVPLLVGWFVNLVLYGFWGICLDSTVLIYLQDNPREALTSAPWWAAVVLISLLAAAVWMVVRAMKWLYAPKPVIRRIKPRPEESVLRRRCGLSLGVLVLCVLDFLAIRGGVTTSTMNPGRAYFSNEMTLNHAAINPVFNFLYSLGRQNNFSKQYRFMSDDEAQAAMQELLAVGSSRSQSVPVDSSRFQSVLHLSPRPNILLILFESFSGGVCHALHPEADPTWMPNINRMYREGLGFTRFYANSFRTDRGVAAVLASYPGQPTNSVMKDQSKCDNLQYLSRRLAEEGYHPQFIHGGDVNFTNMQGFLRAGHVNDIVGDTDFPLADRLSKWGVPDHLMFDYLYESLKSQIVNPIEPQANSQIVNHFTVFLTLSSHEPFDVPYHHFDNEYLNSVAYTDSCFGAFIDRVKADTAIWNNLLIVGLPDHCYARVPEGIQQHEPLRYHIPMFWTGGALHFPVDSLGLEQHLVDVIGQQTDLSATLLGQLGIHHEDFNFSKDLFDPEAPHFAFYSFVDGFGLITDSCSYVQDNKQPGVGLQPGTDDPDGRAQRWGKAYLQTLYDDLSRR